MPTHPTGSPNNVGANDVRTTRPAVARGARKIDPPAEMRAHAALDRVDYRDGFAVDTDQDARSAEEWIRAAFESAPLPVRLFLRGGWTILGARLGPPRSPDHVAGWRLGESRPEHVRLEVGWTIGLRANLVLRRWPSSTVLATFVELDTAASRVVWRLLVPVHHLTLRYLLTRAAGSRSSGSADA